MEIKKIERRLRDIRTRTKNMTDEERLKILIKEIGYHPDALQIFNNLHLISKEQMLKANSQGVRGTQLAKNMLQTIEVKTSNSSELSYKYYGYVRPITPGMLDQMIDMVATRVQLQKEYAELANQEIDDLIQEEETTLGELEELY